MNAGCAARYVAEIAHIYMRRLARALLNAQFQNFSLHDAKTVLIGRTFNGVALFKRLKRST